MQTFVAVCDSGGFTKAAHAVNLTQSAVSLHIKRLEEQVGAQLVMRNARGVMLTDQGEVLLSYARRILALHKEAEDRLSGHDEGLIRIGIIDFFDVGSLSSLLAEFSASYPSVHLQIEFGIGPPLVELLDQSDLDIAIVSNEIGDGGGIPLWRERRVWVAPQDMSLDPEKPVPLALYPPFCSWRKVALERLDRAGRAWTLVAQSTGTAGIMAALDAGLGITTFGERRLPKSLKTLGSEEGLPALPDVEFVLRRGRSQSPPADHLAEMIVNFFEMSAAMKPSETTNKVYSDSRADLDA
ncbi:MAG TPA: LysR substrate-binding domain-containing protein [Methylovirgula sp.]|nr:LysR substrate-binding domain-containing protein [Methylovirgula sp.]